VLWLTTARISILYGEPQQVESYQNSQMCYRLLLVF